MYTCCKMYKITRRVYYFSYFYFILADSFHPIQELRSFHLFPYMAIIFLLSRLHVKASVVLMRAEY